MRLEVTRKTDLAICALVALDAAAPQRLKRADLASSLAAAPAFMAQILNEMVRIGWIDSSPGPTGGFHLMVDVADLSVIDVIEALEGPTDNERCVVADSACGADGYCALHEAWSQARTVLLAHLRTTMIGDLTAGPRDGQPRAIRCLPAKEQIDHD